MPESDAVRPDPLRVRTAQDLGRELSAARQAAGLTVRQLAAKAGVPRGTVQGYLSGAHLPPPGYLEPFARILAVCGEGGAERFALWEEALARARRPAGRRPAGSPSPYRGLAAFGENDVEWFCGREELTELVVARLLGRTGTQGRPLVVVGPSGAGKSSLLRAGVVPALKKRGHATTVTTPGPRPRSSLVGPPGGSATEEPSPVLVVDQFEEVFAREVDAEERRLFIETVCAPREDLVVVGIRADFYPQALRHPLLAAAIQQSQVVVGPMTVQELRRAVTEPARRAKLDVEPALVELVLRESLPRTTGSGPAGTGSGGTRSRAAHDPGALPLLSHALRAAWERHRGGRLTVDDYLTAGGVSGSIAQSAEAVYADLTEGRREEARRLFRRLVRTGDDAADTRRTVPLAEILDGHSETQVGDSQAILDRFASARLLTLDTGTAAITHEALLTAWPRLQEWLDADRAWLRLHRRLGAAAEEWTTSGRDPDVLFRGGVLHLVTEAVTDPARHSELNASERAFVAASLEHQREQLSRDRRRVKQRYRLIALLAVLSVVAAGIAAFARQQQTLNQQEQTRALSRTVAAESDSLRGNDVALSMQLALAAYRISPTPEALSALLDSTAVTPDAQLRPQSGPAETIGVGGDLVATGTGKGTVELWTADAGHLAAVGPLLHVSTSAVTALGVSADGRLVAASGHDRMVHLWDTTDRARPRALPVRTGPGSTIMALALSRDGRTLAAATADGSVWLWGLGSASPAGRALPGTDRQTEDTVTFSPEGTLLAAGGTGAVVRLWSVTAAAAPALLSTLQPAEGAVFSVAVSPDGRTLAAGMGAGHDVDLWNIRDPARPVPAGAALRGPTSWVNTVAFAPGGRSLAAGSSDGRLWLYDLASRQVEQTLPHPQPVTEAAFLADGTPLTVTLDDGTVHWWHLPGPVILGSRDAVFAVAFDADGHRLAIGPGAADDTMTLWDPADIHRPFRLGPPVPGASGSAAFSGSGALSPDGALLAVGGLDGSVQLWNTHDPEHPVRWGGPLPTASRLIESVTLGDQGRLLAAAADDGTVHLLDVSDPARPRALSTLASAPTDEVLQTAVSPDGRLLAAANSDGHGYLYDISRPSHPVLLDTLGGFADAAYAVAFRQDGRLLAVGSADGTVRLWDVSHPARPIAYPEELSGQIGYIYSLAFDPAPASAVLAMSDNEDGAVWLWNVADPAHPVHAATLHGPAGGVFSLAYSPDGHTLAAGGINHSVQLWDADASAAATWICEATGQPLTPTLWAQYVPNRGYVPPCH